MILRLIGATVNWLQAMQGALAGLVVKAGLLTAFCHLASGCSSEHFVLVTVSFNFRHAHYFHIPCLPVASSVHWLCLSPERVSFHHVKCHQE